MTSLDAIAAPSTYPRPRTGWTPDERHLRLDELEPADCRYPYGDGPEFTFCGLRRWENSSYCGYHARLVYKPGDR